ncbi:MAG: hypothetical protein JRF50_17100 [Deltaproteobacteria bacterium]|nr:hypothetical protein [Deltaproteobacteria bacterium]
MRSKDKPLGDKNKAQNEARKTYDEAVFRAFMAFMETKEQADVAHEKALEQAVDKQVKEVADTAYKEAIEQARKLRDEIMDKAREDFAIACEQSGGD